MNKNKPYIIAGAASLIAVISMGSALSLSSKNKDAKSEILALQTQIINMEAAVPDITPEPEIIYLTSTGDTNELTTLKNQLAEKDAQLAALVSGEVPEQREEPRAKRESWEDRMTRMKEEDPEGYAKMIKERGERQQQIRYNLAERTATFMDLDTSTMSADELASHEKLVAMMGQVWEMSEQFQDPEAPPNRDAMREMWNVAREMQPLMQTERNVMLKQLGGDLGYEGKESEDFAAYIDEIYNATSLRSIPGMGRGRGRGR